MTAGETIEKRIKDAAQDWHVIMHSGDIDQETRAAFEAWLHADRDHKRAYRAIEQVYRDLDFAMPQAGVDVDAMLGRHKNPWTERLRAFTLRPQRAAGLAAAAAVFLAVLIVPQLMTSPAPQSDRAPSYATEIAEISEITLQDGSVITLGAKSVIETEFTDVSRQVRLVSGEAFFDVAKDPDRPFYVAAHDTLVRVVGTKFDVKSAGSKVHVAVLEGVVEVIRPETMPETFARQERLVEEAPKQIVTAGERITSARSQRSLPEAEVIRTAQAGAWRSGRLAYEDASLGEIFADFNRYHQQQVRIASPDLRDLRLTATFKTTDLDAAIEMVEAIYPVEADRRRTGQITLRRRPGAR